MRKWQLKNDISHFVAGVIISALCIWITGYAYFGAVIASLSGFVVEIYQFWWKDEPLWLIDRVFDWLGYAAGGLVAATLYMRVIL